MENEPLGTTSFFVFYFYLCFFLFFFSLRPQFVKEERVLFTQPFRALQRTFVSGRRCVPRHGSLPGIDWRSGYGKHDEGVARLGEYARSCASVYFFFLSSEVINRFLSSLSTRRTPVSETSKNMNTSTKGDDNTRRREWREWVTSCRK